MEGRKLSNDSSGRKTNLGFGEVVRKVIGTLKEQGFGALTGFRKLS